MWELNGILFVKCLALGLELNNHKPSSRWWCPQFALSSCWEIGLKSLQMLPSGPSHADMDVGVVIKCGWKHGVCDFVLEKKEHWTWSQEN